MTNVLLTGTKQVGKTTVCRRVAELARARGYQPRGVLTPALYDSNGGKIGFEALDLDSGRRWLLALTEQELSRSESCALGRSMTGPATGHGPVMSGEQGLDGPQIGPYTFDATGLARAIEVLQRACALPGDLLIVDEIGPLELEHGQGFAPVLDLLPLPGPGHVLIVVRPALLPALRRRLGGEFAIYTVTASNRDLLPAYITQELWPHRGNSQVQSSKLKVQSSRLAFLLNLSVNAFGF